MLLRKLLIGATGVAVTLGFSAGSALAASSTTHSSMDVTGQVFTCGTTDLTITGGVLDSVLHFNQDAQGVFHFTGTDVPHNVTLVDSAGNTYTISGADWFGGKGTDPNGQPAVATDTTHFVIHNSSGGVFGTVSVVDHIGSDGQMFSHNFGTCQTPQGG
jgi:hypothetical protein